MFSAFLHAASSCDGAGNVLQNGDQCAQVPEACRQGGAKSRTALAALRKLRRGSFHKT